METLWYHLEMQYVHRTRWIERYFPNIANRGTLSYEDIDKITTTQAEALCQLLIEEMWFYQDRLRKFAARKVSFKEPEDTESDAENKLALRIRLCRDALSDVCLAYQLENPLEG